MQALSGARAAIRRSAQLRPTSNVVGNAQRRGLATEPEVAWADYRSGKVSLQEWVDGNRHKVAGSFFFFYLGLAAYQLRPKKKPAADETATATDATTEAAAAAVAEPAK